MAIVLAIYLIFHRHLPRQKTTLSSIAIYVNQFPYPRQDVLRGWLAAFSFESLL